MCSHHAEICDTSTFAVAGVLSRLPVLTPGQTWALSTMLGAGAAAVVLRLMRAPMRRCHYHPTTKMPLTYTATNNFPDVANHSNTMAKVLTPVVSLAYR